MENKVTDRIPPKPGIAEAIHPGIGNGVSWETDPHPFLLRSPDPTKELDKLLLDNETNLNIISESDTSDVEITLADHITSEINPAEDLSKSKEGIPPGPDESSLNDEYLIPPDLKREKWKTGRKIKANSQDGDKTAESELTEYHAAPDNPPKAPKAGKLVRKAAKSVRKQEEKEIKEAVPELTLTESTLSPYTQWLKGLKGSEYVHPYDDDFAFVQSTGPAKEGISETFAELLASQGYKEQALEMYRKLMEKYPEKSGFFAAKIEALQ